MRSPTAFPECVRMVKGSRRFVLTLAVCLIFKVVVTAAVYCSTNLGAFNSYWMDRDRVPPLIQNQVLTEKLEPGNRWAYLFEGWDAAWYTSIVSSGYGFSPQSFAFLPGLPLFSKLVQFLFENPVVATVLTSLIFGVLWIPLYQSIAEKYINEDAARSTVMYAASPFVLLFTTVVYSEGAFLFFTLATWKLFLDGRNTCAAISAALATLMRPPGFLIVLPMVTNLLARGGRGNQARAVMAVLPSMAAMIAWALYSLFVAGDPLATVHTTEWTGMYTVLQYFAQVVPRSGLNALAFPVDYLSPHWLSPISIWCAILVPPVLALRVAKLDRDLGLYCLAYLLGNMAFGTVLSFPRFMCALFPLSIPLTELLARKNQHLVLVVGGSILACVLMWVGFLDGLFIA